jgi:hypothetical protein
MTAPWHKLLKPLALGVGLIMLALLALVWNGAPPVRAAGPTCTVCLDGGCDYATVQAAVDDLGCMEIKVAQGVYTGVQGRPVPAGYPYPPASGLITQVVYISRSVTVRGGYTTTNWTVPYPFTQPTTLDAGGLGRVLVVAGTISPTLEGLGLTNGRAAGLGGASGKDGGGGGYVLSATTTLSACRVFSNAASYGGGLALWDGPATLRANRVTSNTAASDGGGLYLSDSDATLISNSVTANIAVSLGGGLSLWDSDATLISNRVASNTAGSGGGLFLVSSAAALSANGVMSNTASSGGGLYLDGDSDATLTNTVVADNRASATGSGLYIAASTPRLLHTTIARNIGGDGSGVYVGLRSGNYSTVWLTNTILVSQTTGITVTEGSTAAMNSTLWYSNGTNWGGAGTLTHTGDYTGSPAFVDAGGGDYHIGPGSAAIDRGVDAGVATDKDGRPRDAHPDLGAYEAAVPTGPTCTVCLGGGCDYTAVQAAVDDPACTEIKVAQGVYTGVQGRPVPAGYPSPPASGLITQVVYISRTVTIRGGYTTTNWTASDPVAQPTTLDAGGLGRVLVVAGDISPTLEGLGLTGGNAAGLGGAFEGDGGGGYVINATATLSACRVFSNAASAGGGLLLWYSSATLRANSVTSNTANRQGGGLFLWYSPATLISNSVTANTANRQGGGLFLWYSPATLISNSVTANTANEGGGGLYLGQSPATLSANSVTANTANQFGGGLVLHASPAALTNTVIAANRADINGSGLYIFAASEPRLLHTTIARNTGGDGSGLYVSGFAGSNRVWLTNTILVSHTTGIAVNGGSTAIMSGTLWYGNGVNWGGAVTHTEDTSGDPAFTDPDGGDYHIGFGSAAIDRGVVAGVTTDKDGRLRDARPDLGAYEAAVPTGPTCPVCLDGSCYYTTVQGAVDNPACVEIKVAQGVYTGVQGRPTPAGYDSPPASGLITQVVYISRTVTVRGGYTTTNWTVPDPVAQPTTLDAGGLGRVLVVAGDISPTLEGLGLTGGNSAGLGSYTEADSGGGAYVISATATLSACRVFGNVAGYLGGGLFLTYSPATLSANSVVSNSARYGGGLNLDHSAATLISNSVTSNDASWGGGGLLLDASAATLISNSVTSNTAANYGGGVYLFNSAATLSANTVVSNTAQLEGGGLYLYYSPAVTLSANSVAANTAGNDGGGLLLYNSDAVLSANSVTSNTAGRSGGGLYMISSAAALTNTVVADNQAGATGGGLYLNNAAPRLLHTTIARNHGGDGSGLCVSSAASTVWLTNTILVSQTLGVSVTFGAVVMSNTLWYGNASDYKVGAGTLSHSGDFAGDPAFADPGAGDYHIGFGSAAIDRGVDAGVATDKDGWPRDAWPDLGAYEARVPAGPTCTVCLDGSCDYTAVQGAVDNIRCTEIKVAQGVYTGVQGRPVPAGYDSPPASGLITQVVYISRTVTVRGGYTTTNWTVPDPVAQPTTLDAGGLGRVLAVAGDISPTLEGLGLTNGRAAGLGGLGGTDGGGGVVVINATATLSACRVFSNAAQAGGGLLMYYGSTTLNASHITSNTATDGGGLYLDHSAATLISNSVTANAASNLGGGLYLSYSPATLSANSITSNTAGNGGGLYLIFSPATLGANRVVANTSGCWGGGLYLVGSTAALSADSVTANTADCFGGGLYLQTSAATLINMVVADNWAGINGSGLYIYADSRPRLLHTTIARNGGGDGSGVYVDTIGGASTVWLTNTILVSQTTGIFVAEGSAALMSNTLWDGTGANWSGAGTLTHSGDTAGDPAFVDPAAGDYHIGPASAAVDRGVAAGVTADKDGRPRDARPDLGAYELAALRVTKSVDRDPLPPETPLTYTVRTTSTLDVPLIITAFDVLPDHVGCAACGLSAADLPPGVLDLLGPAVGPTATVAYSTTTIAPGATWVWLIPNLSVQADYTGTLTNSVVITSAEGPHALYVLTSTVGLPASAGTDIYLPIVVKGAQ